jgi:CT1975-like protein
VDYSTALPNRGQDGLAKRTIYGGIERQRISSQSFKAAMRDNLTLVRTDNAGAIASDTMKDLAERLGLSMSLRSALIGDRRLVPALRSRGFSGDRAKEWSNEVMGLWRAEGAKVESDTPLVVGEKEIAALGDACLALDEAKQKPSDLRKLIEHPRELGKASSKAQDAIKSMRAVQSNAGIGERMARKSYMLQEKAIRVRIKRMLSGDIRQQDIGLIFALALNVLASSLLQANRHLIFDRVAALRPPILRL